DLLHVGDTAATAGEMPCTMTWQFHLRDDILSMSVNMRSWDLVWGLSYDVPSFVAVQMMLAQHLNAKLGMYVHDAGSAHVYEQHYDIELEPNVHAKLDLDWILRDDVYNTQNQARKLMDLEEEY
ncbi:MAG TPA: thymidylate synthase, partial [Candidatus Paceibacterota bacterium]